MIFRTIPHKKKYFISKKQKPGFLHNLKNTGHFEVKYYSVRLEGKSRLFNYWRNTQCSVRLF